MKNTKNTPAKEGRTTKEKIREFLRYIVIGVTTTMLNWAVAIIFTELIPLPGSAGTVIAWVVSTIFFAFWAYKFFVFRSRSMEIKLLRGEFISFTAARLLTLGIEFLIMLVFVDLIGFDNDIRFNVARDIIGDGDKITETRAMFDFAIRERYIVKLFACVIVTIVNYIFSKAVVFKKGQYSEKAKDAEN